MAERTGQVAVRQNRVASATGWVSVGRTVGSALREAPEPVAARHLGVREKLHDIQAIAVGTRFASRLGGWRECARARAGLFDKRTEGQGTVGIVLA
ncbi:MAG: hypothetical protein MUF54_17335, partial [Polyangiaceae bacterium]|nr:hypothetical protein [Polyangiaceae bacterium]